MKFFNVKSVEETMTIIHEQFSPINRTVRLPLMDALGLVLAEDVSAREQVPPFARSSVDGYAVRASDSFGASESLPAFFTITDRIEMGEAAHTPLAEGHAQYIPTGGMLPPGADSVVMIEHAEEIGELCNVYRQVAPGENVVAAGEDVQEGTVVLGVGHRLRPQDLGVLAAIGQTTVTVRPRPVVGLLSTGDEIVPPEKAELSPGEIRDINRMTIGGLVRQYGGEVVDGGIVRDELETFRDKVAELYQQVDFLVLSGGSSVGTRDYSVDVLQTLGEPGILVHGVSIKPGKPTIIGKANGKPVMGLPGHPASAMIIFQLFGVPILQQLAGERPSAADKRLRARLSRNVASAMGRTDYLRVRLEHRDDGLWAIPVFGKSGLISTLVASDGVIAIPANKEGLMAGEIVAVELFR